MEPHDLDKDGTLTPLQDFLGNGVPVIAAERIADPDAPHQEGIGGPGCAC